MQAAQLTMTTTPSQLARRLTDRICDNKLAPISDTCCGCEKVISGLWQMKLSAEVRRAVAGERLSSGKFEATVAKADAVHNAMTVQGPTVVSGIATGDKTPTTQNAASSTTNNQQQQPPQPEVAAYSRGFSRGNRRAPRGGQRGGHNRGQQGQRGGQYGGQYGGQQYNQYGNQYQPGPQSQPWGQNQNRGGRHLDGPPTDCCLHHWKFGRSALFLIAPFICPWRDFVVPPPNNTYRP